jgi:hypothetical protein
LGNGSITDFDFIGASNCSKLLETAAAFFLVLFKAMAEEVHSRLLQHSDSGHGGEITSTEERQHGSSSDGGLFLSDLPQAKGRWQFKYHHKLLSSKDFQDSIAHTEVRRQYNRRQRDVIEYFKNVDSNPVGATGTGGEERHEGLAINLSNATNVILLIIKVIASLLSS